MLDPFCKAFKTCIFCSGTWTSISPTYMLQDQNAPRHARQNVQKKVQSTKLEFQNTYNTIIPRGSQGPKM